VSQQKLKGNPSYCLAYVLLKCTPNIHLGLHLWCYPRWCHPVRPAPRALPSDATAVYDTIRNEMKMRWKADGKESQSSVVGLATYTHSRKLRSSLYTFGIFQRMGETHRPNCIGPMTKTEKRRTVEIHVNAYVGCNHIPKLIETNKFAAGRTHSPNPISTNPIRHRSTNSVVGCILHCVIAKLINFVTIVWVSSEHLPWLI